MAKHTLFKTRSRVSCVNCDSSMAKHTLFKTWSRVSCVAAFGLETWPMLNLDQKRVDDKSWM